jgi:hypothetical protein
MILTLVLSLLLLSVPWIVEAASDLYRAKVLKKTDTHKKDIWALRVPLMAGVSLLTPLLFPNEFIYIIHVAQSALLSFGVFVLCFDAAMGIGLVKDPFFLGGSSKTDIFFKQWPKINLLLMRLFIFIITFLIYTQLDYILS